MDSLEELERREEHLSSAGRSRGSLSTFLIGAALAAAGGYMLLQQVTVMSHPWRLWGYDSFGLSLVPLLLGVALLFFSSKSGIGWLLIVAGSAIVLAGVIMNIEFFFRPATLFNTLLMLIMLFAGLGLLGRSFRSL
jgi:predicted membrane channel-forming protein YqfA (hemolysin III family)